MTNWNYDMSAAPKGEYRSETKRVGKIDVMQDVYYPVKIIAGGKCGTVTTSYWVPKRGAWCMFSADTPPIAWQPWPDAP